MEKYYDSRNPARPGIVSPVPKPKVNGLTMGQAAGMRRFDTHTGEMVVKCVPVGIVSTLRTLDKLSPIVPTKSSISGCRRRSPKGAPTSLCHLAKKDGKSMEKAVLVKQAARRARARKHEIERCVRKCQRAIKANLLELAGKMIRRIRKLDRNMVNELTRWAESRQLAGRMSAAFLQVA